MSSELNNTRILVYILVVPLCVCALIFSYLSGFSDYGSGEILVLLTPAIIIMSEIVASINITTRDLCFDLFDSGFGGFTTSTQAKLGDYSARIMSCSNIEHADDFDLVQIRGQMKRVGLLKAMLCKKESVTNKSLLIVPKTATLHLKGKVSREGAYYTLDGWKLHQEAIYLGAEVSTEVSLSLKIPKDVGYYTNVINECVVLESKVI